MKATSSLALAQQGDRHAIATVINKQVYKFGLSASAEQSRRGLVITVEHPHQTPDAQWTASLIYRLLSRVRPAGIHLVWVKGRITGQRLAWKQQLQIDSPRPTPQRLTLRRTDVSTPLAMVSILALSVAGLWHSHRTQNQPWEYELKQVDAALLESTLTQYGTQGWELTAAPKALPREEAEASLIYEIVLKRQVILPTSAVVASNIGMPPLSLAEVADNSQFHSISEQGQTIVKAAAEANKKPAVGSQFAVDQPPPLPVPALP